MIRIEVKAFLIWDLEKDRKIFQICFVAEYEAKMKKSCKTPKGKNLGMSEQCYDIKHRLIENENLLLAILELHSLYLLRFKSCIHGNLIFLRAKNINSDKKRLTEKDSRKT